MSPRYGNSINSAEYIFDARVPTGLDIRYLSGVPTSPAQLCGPASYSNIGQAGSFTAITRGLRTSNYTALMYAHRAVAKRDLPRAALTRRGPTAAFLRPHSALDECRSGMEAIHNISAQLPGGFEKVPLGRACAGRSRQALTHADPLASSAAGAPRL